jgi:DNA-binding transcriptional ArsR family regulator
VSERSGRKDDSPSADRLAEAMAHPVRIKLLIAVTEKGEGGATIGQVADRTGEPKRKVRYHLEALVDSGLVAIASEQKRAGVVERYFRAVEMPILDDAAFEELDKSVRRQIAVEILKVIFDDVSAAVRAKSLGERAGNLARLPIEVDEQGWQELTVIHKETLKRLEQLRGDAAARLRASTDPPALVAMNALLLFAVPPWPAQ